MSDLEIKEDTVSDNELETKSDNLSVADSDSDSSEDEYDDDFKKFEQDTSKDILLNYHPETSHISHKQMLVLCKIVKNKN